MGFRNLFSLTSKCESLSLGWQRRYEPVRQEESEAGGPCGRGWRAEATCADVDGGVDSEAPRDAANVRCLHRGCLFPAPCQARTRFLRE